MNLQPSQDLGDTSLLLPIFGRLPDDLKVIVCDQVEEFLHQASFLRRADLYQAHLVHTKGITLEAAEVTVEFKAADASEAVVDAAIGDELSVVQSLTTKLPPVLAHDIAASFDDELACKPQAVQRWFEARNQAVSKACSRVRKKYGSSAAASVSMRGNAVIRSIAAQPEDVVQDAASALAACLSPMSALETSMKLMSLLKSDDPSRPALKDNCASRAFAMVSKCPAVMLQSMFLRAVTNTSGVQLTALDRTESYTVIAQWLQDAVSLHNDPLVQLCLGALCKIPFTEVHIICFARHHMISGAEASAGAPAAANNPTILDFVRRLTEAERSPVVRHGAQALLDKWGRVDLESDHVILGQQQQQRSAPALEKKKGATGVPLEPPRPQVFPNDRRMKAPQPIALHRDGRSSAELVKSSSSNMSKAAAQRRVHTTSGTLSVSDIKKRKEQLQLMQKLGKKQRSLPGAGVVSAPTSNAAVHRPSASTLQTGRSVAAHSSAHTSVSSAAVSRPVSGQHHGSASAPLARTSSAVGGTPPFAANAAAQSPQRLPTEPQGAQHSEQRRLSVPERLGTLPLSPARAAGATPAENEEALRGVDEPQRGLSSLLQMTQHAAAQQVRKRRETLPVPWQVAEACLDEAKQRLAAAKRGGSRWHPEVRAALQAAVTQGEADSQARWSKHASGEADALDTAAMKELSEDGEAWSSPEALTELPDSLMQICASWAADSTERAVQREREYHSVAASAGSEPAAVKDPDDVPDATAAAAAAETARRIPFWLQPPEDIGAEEWKRFEGRTHMVGAAQAWRAGLRFVLGDPGIPAAGILSADMAAARQCDGTEAEDAEPPTAAVVAAEPPAVAMSQQTPDGVQAHHQQLYPATLPGPPPQQEYQAYQEYQPPPVAAPVPMHMQAALQPQVYHGGGVAGFAAPPHVQYEQPGQQLAQVMGQGMPGAQYVQHLAPGQQPQQIVYAQPGMHYASGAPVYAGQYLQQSQPIAYAGAQYPGGHAVMYHYAQQAGPAGGSGEQPGRMY